MDNKLYAILVNGTAFYFFEASDPVFDNPGRQATESLDEAMRTINDVKQQYPLVDYLLVTIQEAI